MTDRELITYILGSIAGRHSLGPNEVRVIENTIRSHLNKTSSKQLLTENQ
jgi:hypothetical protein